MRMIGGLEARQQLYRQADNGTSMRCTCSYPALFMRCLFYAAPAHSTCPGGKQRKAAWIEQPCK